MLIEHRLSSHEAGYIIYVSLYKRCCVIVIDRYLADKLEWLCPGSVVPVYGAVFHAVENALTESLPLIDLSLIVGNDLFSPCAAVSAGIWGCLTLFEDVVYTK